MDPHRIPSHPENYADLHLQLVGILSNCTGDKIFIRIITVECDMNHLASSQSDEYREAIYQVDWFSKKSVMTSVIIMLSQKPLKLTACKFFVVSVEMFVMILQTTISYFFLLKTLDESK
ncbi:uncharacterized protein [Fopius arisanus]|uniref:Uncharacterized protein n=1 Tax=Fopius arisanus TaxID=64838 RepID=A0A9R1U3E9_9HYME|nr:PREDICTED: uncharacterized protein LOC105269224 [Fopius arisanus]